jgi:hypothetical protein
MPAARNDQSRVELMPTSPDLTVLGLVIIGVGVVAFLFVVGAWIVAPFMLYGIDSRLRETNELLRFLATRPPPGRRCPPAPASGGARCSAR